MVNCGLLQGLILWYIFIMKMKKIFIKCTNWILAGIMGLLGFAGCDRTDVPEYGVPYVEYGVPSATYTVKGAVVNEATGASIAGIRVGYYPEVWDEEAFGTESEYYWESNAHVITNANGGFTLTSDFFDYGKNLVLPVYVEDIDGEENGSFQSKKVDVDFKNAVQSGTTGNWYGGEYTVTTNIQLAEIEIN